MSRTLSTTISTAIAKNATQPTYLLRMGFSADSPMTEIRSCTWGSDITWNAETWDASGIEVKNLSRTACTLEFPIGTIGAGYSPDMMRYDGSTGYYSKSSITTTGNKVTGVLRFNLATFATADFMYLCRHIGSASPDRERFVVVAWATDYADADLAGRISVWTRNSANTLICYLHSGTGLLDGQNHTLFYSFDGDAGTATYIIDGVSADIANPDRIAPTTGTLATGATGQIGLGASNIGTKFTDGSLGFFGIIDAYLTNWSDFMVGSVPKALDEFTWTEWGAQPLFWNDYGDMQVNEGSAGNMTKNGTITRVDLSSVNSLDPWLPIAMADGFRNRTVTIYQHYTDATSSPQADAVLMFTGIMDRAVLTDKIRVSVQEKSRTIPFPPESVDQSKFTYLLEAGTVIEFTGKVFVVR